MVQAKFHDVDPDSYYDFNKERYGIMVFGGYAVMRRSKFTFFINILCIIFIIILYSYGVCAGIMTMAVIAVDKSAMVQAFYATGLLFVSIGLHLGRVATDSSLKQARDLLKSGVYKYNEKHAVKYLEIKKERKKRMKFFVSFVSKGMFFCAFNYTVLIPMTTLLLVGKTVSEGELNPYLPLHLYIPFNTTTLVGYTVAFLLNAITLFTMYTSFICHEELYISCSLQLASEFEVLSYSLRNIAARAYSKMRGNIPTPDEQNSIHLLYDSPEFQKCLYLCLRENIRHHQAILRLKKAVSPYIETTSTVVVLFFSLLMAAAILIMLENTRPQLTLITDIFGFLPMCWVGQLLTDESAQTKNALFDTPWPYCDDNFTTLLKVFMSNTQVPIMLRVKGFNLKLCLETFGDMVSVGYKILNVMR